MAMDWQVFCKTTDDATVMASCFGKGGDITYLQWMFHAWGWTLSVALAGSIASLFLLALMCVIVGLQSTGVLSWMIP